MFRGVSSIAFTYLSKTASKTTAVNGWHSRITRHHGLLCHLAVQLGWEPPQVRYITDGNFHRDSDGEKAQHINGPRRPSYWQRPSRQEDQQGLLASQPGVYSGKAAGRAKQQNFSVGCLRTPPQITAFIKRKEKLALGLTGGSDPEAGVIKFCGSMDGLLATPGLRTNFIHFSAITTAAAHIWTDAQRSPKLRGHANVSEMLEGLYERCLQRLQLLLADMGAREISNVLWSSATLSFNPDDTVPKMVHALTSRFLRFVDVLEEQQRPNAQQAANVLWAIATLDHPAATLQVVDTICLHFLCLTQQSDAQQRPTAQECANAMWALARLGHSSAAALEMVDSVCLRFACLAQHSDARQHPKAQNCANAMWALATLGHASAAAKEMVDPVCLHFAHLTQHSGVQQRPTAQGCSNFVWALAKMEQHSAATTKIMDSACLHFGRLVESPIAQQRPTAQAISNLVWALGTLKHTPPDDRLLDGLCEYMRSLVCSHDHRARPNAQAIANTVWALSQLRHAPSQDVVTAMSDYLVDLCQTPGLQPNSQAISNAFIACAELELDVKSACVEALLKHFMNMHVSSVDYQHYCNVAWSLAVMHCVDFNIFEALLDKLTTKHKLVVEDSGPPSTSAQLTAAGASQLYQALAWLMPPSGSQLMKAWSGSRTRLRAIAPEPAVSKLSTPGQTVMWAALAMYNVPYQDQMRCGVYRADALLSPHDSKAAKVILMVEQPKDLMKNVPNRVMLGSAVFRNQLLSRYGTVITIPYNPRRSTAESMAEDIKAAVEAKTGLPLDSFRS